jgi:hypothetical protein
VTFKNPVIPTSFSKERPSRELVDLSKFNYDYDEKIIDVTPEEN